jgi:hypothetical protein
LKEEHMSDNNLFEGMEVTEDHPAAQFSPISADAVARLVRKGIISLPPKPEQQPVIEALKEVWGDDWYMRHMVSRVRKRDREMLVYFPLLGRVEKYILNIYLKKEEGSRRIETTAVQEKVFKAFKARRSIEEIKKIRDMAKRYKGQHETNAEKERILLQGIKV